MGSSRTGGGDRMLALASLLSSSTGAGAGFFKHAAAGFFSIKKQLVFFGSSF